MITTNHSLRQDKSLASVLSGGRTLWYRVPDLVTPIGAHPLHTFSLEKT